MARFKELARSATRASSVAVAKTAQHRAVGKTSEGHLTEATSIAARRQRDEVHRRACACGCATRPDALYVGHHGNRGLPDHARAMVRNSIALGRHRYRLTHDDACGAAADVPHRCVLPMLAIFDVGGTTSRWVLDAGVALEDAREVQVTALYPSFVRSCGTRVYRRSPEPTVAGEADEQQFAGSAGVASDHGAMPQACRSAVSG